MSEPSDAWAARLEEQLAEKSDKEEVEGFVRDLYESAQRDLDTQRAQAEFEREE
ncbi:hypothetical protein OG552_35860 [Streptomyces sp. NBC_01476]|uniref:hypothetical protein n=1 Tax=Streptomyces sp. NBC_01476 TaxID=2903881 RepID=UPI002E30D8F3|nr:hypothetical protein [Streptomyces sp. NBC_01476]